jgi:HPt (histidine-containing phosphotransfer) domain-containing protein
LRTFLQDVGARFVLLEAIPDSSGLPAFTTFSHALKSALANIGADALSESAAVLEQAGRDGDMAVIRDKLAAFREDLAGLTARVGAATEEARSGPGEAAGEAALEELSREALTSLKSALEAKDTDGVDNALAKLQNFQLSPKTRAVVDDLAQHILFGDFRKAAEAVRALTGGEA